MTTPSTRTVKVSDRIAKRIKVGAALIECTQEEFVAKAVEQLYESAAIQREIEKYRFEDRPGVRKLKRRPKKK